MNPQNMKGSIFHLYSTFSFPYFLTYHSLAVSAVTARLTVTKIKAQKIVWLIHAPSGAPRIANAR